MTITIAAAAIVALSVALWLEERAFRRMVARDRARTEMARVIDEMHDGGATVRCLMHPVPVVVEDLAAHLRLWHQPRAVGAEDRAGWSA